MPRKPRLDCPGLLYHIIVRGIEKGHIFNDDKDRDFFLSRLAEILKDTYTSLYAFALIPNHFHLLIRRDNIPISKVMQRLLTSYALYFNKRHERVGHLFQNRYKSIICQEDTYLLELIRYINLNPLRAGAVDSLKALKTYPYSGHAYLLGKKRRADWLNQDYVLSHFAKTGKRAKGLYLKFITDGVSIGKRDSLSGGGLQRSLGYPSEYPKQKQTFDDRILGDGGFVEEIMHATDNKTTSLKKIPDFESLLLSTCKEFSATEAEILGESKKKRIAEARAILSYKMAKEMGLSGSDIARRLHVTRSAASKMIKKGESLKQSLSSMRLH